MRHVKESDLQKAILQLLNWSGFLAFKFPSVGIYKPGTGKYIPMARRGISDIIAVSPRGKFVAIEVKRPGGKPSEEQSLFLEEVRSHGGAGLLVSSVEEVQAWMKAEVDV